ncbi:MAG: arsenite methyltransferase [bacterium]|nr:arsenite methyltransferase [Candidatus Sumerlaeota bacterium]
MTEIIREQVKQRYAKAAAAASRQTRASCCGSDCSGGGDVLDAAKDYISSGLYSEAELKGLPMEAFLASLGCGNPTALARLNPGETVLDLGSGGGIDVLLSAKRVGPDGFAYGIDMTDEMLDLAERNREVAGVTNVKFLKGTIEEIPLPDNSVDVIISNCVINLSGDKDQVLRQAYRVLRPGGRFAVSDMVINGTMPESIKGDILAWSGCVAGALSVDEYTDKLQQSGFRDIEIVPTRVHRAGNIMASRPTGLEGLPQTDLDAIDGKLWSAFIRARKPAASQQKCCCCA